MLLNKINWTSFSQTCKLLGDDTFPEVFNDKVFEDEETLKRVHRALLELDVIKGQLVCNKCELNYPINNGILSLNHKTL
jgi:multifunctional methyltransferase subunit TRM112